MVIVHLAASPFFGGPERQMLGLATHLPQSYRSVFLSFSEGGRCKPFLNQLRRHRIEGVELEKNTPRALAAASEVAGHLRHVQADLLLCHGYKPDIIGWLAARRCKIPAVAVSRGWTWATRRVRFYEFLDRRVLGLMDRVVCVSQEQANRVQRAGVRPDRIAVIRNSIETGRFSKPDGIYRNHLENFFPTAPRRIVLAAGRLSPEKGFGELVSSAAIVMREDPEIGFVLFGDGPLRLQLEQQVLDLNLKRRFVLAGFREDVDKFLPHADLVALPSFTEGLPNVALEAQAAAVPVIATAVGGTPEVVRDGVTGHLVPAGDPPAMARRILDCLRDEASRIAMGQRGRALIEEEFTFPAQAAAYQRLFAQLTVHPVPRKEMQPI